ncbi:MAG TPA: rhomboid family intramembrane serine protease [Pseudogracilibacillus sp.]|nr:rhomboid family intramembrane serine protease [Pseudogracilibacillus sp.]
MFFRTEKSIKEFFKKYPIVSILAIINVGLWFIVNFLKLPFGLKLYDLGIGHNLSVLLLDEYWRLFTPIFLHTDLSHVAFNTFTLILFGPALEKMLGKFKFISIYLITGIIGNLGTFIVDIHSITPHLGASGAIYGLFGVYIYMVLFRKDLISKQDSQIIITILVLGLVMSFIRPNINISAHLFGFLSGFIIGPLVLRHAKNFFSYR